MPKAGTTYAPKGKYKTLNSAFNAYIRHRRAETKRRPLLHAPKAEFAQIWGWTKKK